MAFPGPALALDVGTAKIGVAVSDAAQKMAFPLHTMPRNSVARDAAALANVARERGVSVVIVGLPDAGGRMVHLARQVGDALAVATGLPVHYVDEGYTSAEARARIADAGLRRDTVDAQAAAIILEQWLGSRAPAG